MFDFYCTVKESDLPKENRFEFGDKVKYHSEGSKYDGCEGTVIDQQYHYCYGDYETKVNVKLQQGGYTDVWMWGNNLTKLQGGE